MTHNFAAMFAHRDLRASPVIAVQTVMAMRIATLYARAGRDPLPDMAVRLRSMRAAQALQTLIASVARIWPEPFQARRPCCMAMSPDEALIADMAAAALHGDRAAAIHATRDFLPSLSRDRLFRGMIELVDAIRTAQPGPCAARADMDAAGGSAAEGADQAATDSRA